MSAITTLISQSRSTGNLILTGLHLKKIPDLNVVDPKSQVKWWEIQDITKLDISQNEFEQIDLDTVQELGALSVLKV
jgi:hypothetical protein